MIKCRDDLTAITRYVTWNLNERSSAALGRALPDQTDIVAVYKVALEASDSSKGEDTKEESKSRDQTKESGSKKVVQQEALAPMRSTRKRSVDRDYRNLLQLMEEAVMSRDANRTNMVVGGLVQHIVSH